MALEKYLNTFVYINCQQKNICQNKKFDLIGSLQSSRMFIHVHIRVKICHLYKN